jgi:predicted nucleic acid-binding protein
MSQLATYVLDTTALIDFSKGFEPSKSNLLQLIDQRATLAVCCVSVAEFFTGLTESEIAEWKAFFSKLPYWDISPAAAIQAGIWRGQFAARGLQLSTTDALIAAVAWQHQAIVITNNTKHYPMPEVQLLSVRELLP